MGGAWPAACLQTAAGSHGPGRTDARGHAAGAAPTVVRGEMARHWLENKEVLERVLQRIPLGRVAEPEDVVGPVLFFCSPAAAFVTGQVMYLDGGLTATQ